MMTQRGYRLQAWGTCDDHATGPGEDRLTWPIMLRARPVLRQAAECRADLLAGGDHGGRVQPAG
jgi:hypothetical protein